MYTIIDSLKFCDTNEAQSLQGEKGRIRYYDLYKRVALKCSDGHKVRR